VLAHKGESIEETMLVPGRLIIGRTSDNDLQIDSRFVSRHHAQVVTTMQGSVIEDLNSTNGIYVRGKKIRRHKLIEGDVVQIGQHTLTYLRADALGTGTTALEEDAEEPDPDSDSDSDSEPDESVVAGEARPG